MHYWGHGLGKCASSIYCCIGQGYHQHYRGPKHGLRTSRENFFLKIPIFWAWADKLGKKFGGILGIFGLSALFLQKIKPLYPDPKYWDLNLGRN